MWSSPAEPVCALHHPDSSCRAGTQPALPMCMCSCEACCVLLATPLQNFCVLKGDASGCDRIFWLQVMKYKPATPVTGMDVGEHLPSVAASPSSCCCYLCEISRTPRRYVQHWCCVFPLSVRRTVEHVLAEERSLPNICSVVLPHTCLRYAAMEREWLIGQQIDRLAAEDGDIPGMPPALGHYTLDLPGEQQDPYLSVSSLTCKLKLLRGTLRWLEPMSAAMTVAGFVQTGAGIVTGTGENTKFMGLLMGKINGKELEKRCAPLGNQRTLRTPCIINANGSTNGALHETCAQVSGQLFGRLWKDESWADARYTLEMLRQVLIRPFTQPICRPITLSVACGPSSRGVRA